MKTGVYHLCALALPKGPSFFKALSASSIAFWRKCFLLVGSVSFLPKSIKTRESRHKISGSSLLDSYLRERILIPSLLNYIPTFLKSCNKPQAHYVYNENPPFVILSIDWLVPISPFDHQTHKEPTKIQHK